MTTTACCPSLRRSRGPSFVLATVTVGERPAPRIPDAPGEIRDRFRRTIGSAGTERP